MKLIKKHARFLIVAVVLAVVLFIANGQFESIAQTIRGRQAAAQSLMNNNYTALFADTVKYGEPATVHGRALQDKTQLVSAITDIANDRMIFDTDPAFTVEALPAGANAPDDMVEFYRRKSLELQNELRHQRFFGPDVRSASAFGFAEGRELTDSDLTKKEATVRDHLRKLDIARTVARSVQRSGVHRLVKLNFSGGVSQSLHQRGVPTVSTIAGEDPYFIGDGLEIDVEATEETLYALLIDLQRPEKDGMRNRFLAVETFKLTKPDLLDPKDDRITARIVVVAYRVNHASSYPPDESDGAAQQPAAGQPRQDWRRRG